MMFKKLIIKLSKKSEILSLALLILATIIFTSYYNINKKKNFLQLHRLIRQYLF